MKTPVGAGAVMLTWSEACEVAVQLARQQGASQLVVEAAGSGRRERFVVGPSRGWSPDPARWIARAKVRDQDGSLVPLQHEWEPPE